MLNELLRLKRYREDKAEMAVSTCRFGLQEASRYREQAKASLIEYRSWSCEREREMYAEVCRRIVRLRDLEYLKEDVVGLHIKERSLEEQLATAKVKEEQADKALAEARQNHRTASRAREKFVQLVSVQAEEIRLEGERKEDVETEDLYAIRRDREDWEGRDDE